MESQTIIPRDDTGKVYIENNTLFWDVAEANLLKIDIDAVRVIGEYTTVHALFRNDWFIVFVLDHEKSFQISAYAQGMNEVLDKLSKSLNSSIKVQLALCTDFKSNVIWPQDLSGQELYELKIIESRSLFDRLRARLGFGDPVELVFRDSVKAAIS